MANKGERKPLSLLPKWCFQFTYINFKKKKLKRQDKCFVSQNAGTFHGRASWRAWKSGDSRELGGRLQVEIALLD